MLVTPRLVGGPHTSTVESRPDPAAVTRGHVGGGATVSCFGPVARLAVRATAGQTKPSQSDTEQQHRGRLGNGRSFRLSSADQFAARGQGVGPCFGHREKAGVGGAEGRGARRKLV